MEVGLVNNRRTKDGIVFCFKSIFFNEVSNYEIFKVFRVREPIFGL